MQRPDLAAELRMLTNRCYRIYFQDLDGQVVIERVLHHALEEGRQSFR